MDMVTEKNSDVVHDFFNDPLRLRSDGTWLKARLMRMLPAACWPPKPPKPNIHSYCQQHCCPKCALWGSA